MLSPKHPTLSLLLLLSLSVASGCAKPAGTFQPFPAAADLKEEAKPQPTADILTSATAEANYNAAIEGWGERGWRQVARICRWAVTNGAELPFDCPPPPPDS